jgi:hypothetical protein
MELIEIWAALSGVVMTGLMGLGAWLVRKSFEQDSQIAVLESNVDAIKEDLHEIKRSLQMIAENMVKK